MGLLVDPMPNSLNYHHLNCMADSKENYQLDLGSERVKLTSYELWGRHYGEPLMRS